MMYHGTYVCAYEICSARETDCNNNKVHKLYNIATILNDLTHRLSSHVGLKNVA